MNDQTKPATTRTAWSIHFCAMPLSVSFACGHTQHTERRLMVLDNGRRTIPIILTDFNRGRPRTFSDN